MLEACAGCDLAGGPVVWRLTALHSPGPFHLELGLGGEQLGPISELCALLADLPRLLSRRPGLLTYLLDVNPGAPFEVLAKTRRQVGRAPWTVVKMVHERIRGGLRDAHGLGALGTYRDGMVGAVDEQRGPLTQGQHA
jgi:hypothetical protein